MHRPKSRRRSAARIAFWGAIAVAYVATLAYTTDLLAADAGSPTAAAAGALAQPVAFAAVEETATASTAVAQEALTEAPLVTLGIAGAIVIVLGVAYVVHAVRRPRTRRTRLVARHITTLTS